MWVTLYFQKFKFFVDFDNRHYRQCAGRLKFSIKQLCIHDSLLSTYMGVLTRVVCWLVVRLFEILSDFAPRIYARLICARELLKLFLVCLKCLLKVFVKNVCLGLGFILFLWCLLLLFANYSICYTEINSIPMG